MVRFRLTAASVVVGAAAVGVILAGCANSSQSGAAESNAATASSSPATANSSAPSPNAATTATAGSYITLDQYRQNQAAYAQNNVVLFFNASWCPSCQRAVKNLDGAKSNFPAGLTVVSVDYDENSALKKEYGVTTQHTFVQIAPDGAAIKKWSGSETVEAINAKV